MNNIFLYANEITEYEEELTNDIIIAVLIFLTILLLIGIKVIIKSHKNYKKHIDIYIKTETEIDTLTGAFTRKAGELVLSEELKQITQNKKTSALLMMIDIDNFKKINDTYGHDVGDIVLRKVSETVKATIRSDDQLFRWGGEEFILLCKQIHQHDYKQISQKIVNCINELNFKNNEDDFTVTISVGVTYYNENDNSHNDAIKRADEALYYSKNTGKNRFTFFDDMNK